MAETRADQVVTHDDVRELLAEQKGPAISLYQPTHRAGPEADQDTVRLKNLLSQAEERLLQRGIRRTDANPIIGPIRDLLGNAEFWRHQRDGLAIFSAPDRFRCFKLPFEVEELIVVGNSVHIAPLLPALTQGHFYILAISQASLRLLRATEYEVEEVDLAGLDIPRNLSDAMRFDDFEKTNLQRHPTSRQGTGGGRVLQHGHGPGDEDVKIEILRYFQAVDAGVSKLLAPEGVPLVVAAVDYLIPLYRQASSYGNILEKGAEGNPDQLNASELHERSWPVVEPHFRARLDRVKERFGNAIGSGLASSDLGEVLGGAHAGRIESLLIRRGRRRWGTFDLATGRIEEVDEPGAADVELVDLAARQTVLHGGEVHLVAEEDMPAGDAAAVFRF